MVIVAWLLQLVDWILNNVAKTKQNRGKICPNFPSVVFYLLLRFFSVFFLQFLLTNCQATSENNIANVAIHLFHSKKCLFNCLIRFFLGKKPKIIYLRTYAIQLLKKTISNRRDGCQEHQQQQQQLLLLHQTYARNNQQVKCFQQ